MLVNPLIELGYWVRKGVNKGGYSVLGGFGILRCHGVLFWGGALYTPCVDVG